MISYCQWDRKQIIDFKFDNRMLKMKTSIIFVSIKHNTELKKLRILSKNSQTNPFNQNEKTKNFVKKYDP